MKNSHKFITGCILIIVAAALFSTAFGCLFGLPGALISAGVSTLVAGALFLATMD